MASESVIRRRKGAVSAARTEWSEIGPFGRVAFAGVLLSLIVAVGLGIWIPRQVRLHLLTARAQLITSIGDEIAERGLVPVGDPGSDSYQRLADEISLSLLGGETVRVKLWAVDGRVAYSDDLRLVGSTFELTPTARKALAGEAAFSISDLSEPAHAFERPLGSLIEFFVPVHEPAGGIVGIFEVEERVDALETTLTNVRRNVWLAIGSGVGLLGVFMGSLTMSSARVLNRRRRQAERLLGSLFRAQEEERRRTVGALHDDVGQPLFRLLYGLEGSRAKLPSGHPVSQELEGLAELTRGIDRTLRGELRLLHQGIDEELGLAVLLQQLVETARAETELNVDLEIGTVDTAGIGQASKVALIHAAREAITNVRKHAGASQVIISVQRTSQEITVTVVDDGVGVRSPEGLGLVTTRERLEALGGGIRVFGSRGGGTVFRATVPLSVGTV